MGQKMALGLILAALSAGAGAGVAIAATQGAAKHAKTPLTAKVRAIAHHCHSTRALGEGL